MPSSYITAPLAYGQAVHPFAASWFYNPLPTNAAVDPSSAAVVTALAAQAAIGTNLNATTYTAEPLIVPASQPLVPVATAYNSDGGFTKKILALGVPIPPGTRPTPDGNGDCSLTIWQPDYVSPYLQSNGAPILGRMYELWVAQVTLDVGGNEIWTAKYGKRDYNVNVSSQVSARSWVSGPHASEYATNPDSTYVPGTGWTTGSGLPLAPTILTLADVQRGFVDHPLGLLVTNARAGSNQWVWPATQSDGNLTSSPIKEGSRLAFPPGYVPPSGLHPLAALIAQGARDHGFIVNDQSGVVVVRCAPSVKAAGYLAGTMEYQIFNGFPWHDLQMLTPGTAAAPVPLV